MKVIFHPYYDARCLIDGSKYNGVMLDTIVAGPLGLLDELELRLGLTARQHSTMERIVEYLSALRTYFATHATSPFAAPFSANEYSVATELLHWRDMLRLTGWNGSMKGISARLDMLADIEPEVVLPSSGDRWLAVIEEVPAHDFSWLNMELHCPPEWILPLYGRLFSLLKEHGATIVEADVPHFKPSVRRMRVKELWSAFRAIPTLDPAKWTLICGHGKLLNNVLHLNGSPETESAVTESATSIIQLFESGFLLFDHPSAEESEAVDIYLLLSYLQAKPNPIPHKVNITLQRLLLSKAGIDPVLWRQTIDNVLNESEHADRERQRISKLLDPFFGSIDHNAIPTGILRSYAVDLKDWALQCGNIYDSRHAAEFALLARLCDVVIAMLDRYPQKTLDSHLLRTWITSIRTDETVGNTEARTGSFDTIEHPGALVDPVDRAIWADCFGVPEPRYDFGFLTFDEVAQLNRLGATVWSRGEQTKAELNIIRRSLGLVRSELILVTPETVNGQPLELHPIIEELDWTDIEPLQIPASDVTVQLPPVCEKRAVVNIGPGRISPRERESFSSLESLIQQPFDYVMQYSARLSSGGLRQLEELNRIEGNVAHRTLELLAREAGNDTLRMSLILTGGQSVFDRIFRQAVKESGMALLLPQHEIERKTLRERLHGSMSALMQIIIAGKWKVNGFEVESSTPLLENKGPLLTARADLLLEQGDGGPLAIFDLKWSNNEKLYEDYIHDGMDLQLHLYRYAMEASLKRTVNATGYFILTRGLLLSADLQSSNHVRHVDSPVTVSDVVARVRKSYLLRYEQLREGVVEEGEEMQVAKLPYGQSGEADSLWPLSTKTTGDTTVKFSDRYNNSPYRIFKGTVK